MIMYLEHPNSTDFLKNRKVKRPHMTLEISWKRVILKNLPGVKV